MGDKATESEDAELLQICISDAHRAGVSHNVQGGLGIPGVWELTRALQSERR